MHLLKAPQLTRMHKVVGHYPIEAVLGHNPKEVPLGSAKGPESWFPRQCRDSVAAAAFEGMLLHTLDATSKRRFGPARAGWPRSLAWRVPDGLEVWPGMCQMAWKLAWLAPDGLGVLRLFGGYPVAGHPSRVRP